MRSTITVYSINIMKEVYTMVSLNLNLKNKLLVLLVVLSGIYTAVLVYAQTVIGVSYWDIFVYLQNSMLFSHINIGSQLSVPPILSLITSIPFQMGFISETTLFVVSGILFILMLAGIYLLFNERFSLEISFVGSLFFSMLSLVVTWAVTGSNDLPALSFSVWALYFTVRGLNNNFNYYYPAFLCFIVSFFTRFTEGFILIVMLGYLWINKEKVKIQIKENNISRLFLFIIILCTVIGGIYLYKQHTIPFLSQFMEVSSSNQVSSVNVGYELNPYYYIQNIPSFLTSMGVSPSYDETLNTVYNIPTFLSYVILLLTGIGIVSCVLNLFIRDEWYVCNRNGLASIIVLSVITIISYTHISYIFTEILFTIIVLLTYKHAPQNIKQMDLLMFLWMGIFIILHSYHPVKVDRYILPTFIPIIYYMITGIEYTTKKIGIKNRKTPLIILTVLLVILIPINYSYIESITHPNPQSHEEKQAAVWLKTYDPQLTDYNISSDRGVAFSWYLKKYTYTAIPRVLEQNNDTLENKLKTVNAEYYIDSTSNTGSIKGYHVIYNNGNEKYNVKIYQKD